MNPWNPVYNPATCSLQDFYTSLSLYHNTWAQYFYQLQGHQYPGWVNLHQLLQLPPSQGPEQPAAPANPAQTGHIEGRSNRAVHTRPNHSSDVQNPTPAPGPRRRDALDPGSSLRSGRRRSNPIRITVNSLLHIYKLIFSQLLFCGSKRNTEYFEIRTEFVSIFLYCLRRHY